MYRYSPHPIESYLIQGLEGHCEAGIISKLPNPGAVWNLFWLSTPQIDNIPGSGSNWLNVYKPTVNGLAAITSDIIFDEVLNRKLLMHPVKFAAWVKVKDMTDYDSFAKYGVDWISSIVERCGESAFRIATENTQSTTPDNVISLIMFRSKKVA